MAAILSAEHLSKSYTLKKLLTDVTIYIGEHDRIGVVGVNGTGKSTLLKLLSGLDEPDGGVVMRKNGLRVSYLPQMPDYSQPRTAVQQVLFDAPKDVGAPDEYEAKALLSQFGIDDFDADVRTLSGGQKKRVALAAALIRPVDLLMLDEPTNHIDAETIALLEGRLAKYRGALMMVTHDRYFLDRVCNLILELDNHTIYSYRGNFRYYMEKRQERIDATRAEIERANNLYRRELEWMRRQPQARGHKARYREEAFYDLEAKAKQRMEERQMRLKSKNVYIGSKIFECQYVSKAFDEKIILKDFYYNFQRFEKMGIVGNNGTGKSTFIKMLLGEVGPDSGQFDVGDTVRFGYFSQDGMKFNDQQRVIDVISDIAEYIDYGGGKHITAGQLLQHFLFTPEQQYDYVYKLSGGERRKLYLCTVLMRNPNFLVLDEPTNDLDIQTLEVLEEYLQDFPGCVIIVSHDRFFMDKIVDHLLVFRGNGEIKDFPGNYTQFREWESLKPKAEAADKPNTTSEKKEKREFVGEQRRKKTYKEKCEFERLEKEIAELEKEQKQIEEELCSGTLSIEQLTEKSKRLPVIKESLEEKEMRWLELSEID